MIGTYLRRLVGRQHLKPGEIALARIRRFLPRNPVILEAGACDGVDTVRMANMWPRGTIHAFEPIPRLFEKLKTRVAEFQNVSTYEMALADRTGSLQMYKSDETNYGSSSLLEPREHLRTHPEVTFPTAISVATMTMDEWARVHEVARVDFMWLDMQGYELAALKHGLGLLAGVRAIHTEVSTVELYKGCPLYAEVKAWLAGRSFRVEVEAMPWSEGGNVLFVRG